MTQFVRSDLLATFIGDEGLDGDRADLALTYASGLIRAGARQQIDEVLDDVVVLSPEANARVLYLPQTPVTAVTLVEELDRDGTARAISPNGYCWEPTGRMLLTSPPLIPRRLRVTYDHGYAVIPSDLRGVTLALAARLLGNPLGLKSEMLGGYTTAYGPDATISDADQLVIDKYAVGVIA